MNTDLSRMYRVAAATALLLAVSGTVKADVHVAADSDIAAGRYLVVVSGCNDCHTAGYLATEGQVPESEWLKGSPVGWRGDWGTTYSSNLRLLAGTISEDGWVQMLRSLKTRPPMPWMNIRNLSEPDARAMYRYIRSLGDPGERMPAAIDAVTEPVTPYIVLVPQHMERLAQATSP